MTPKISFIAGEQITIGNLPFRTTQNSEALDLQECVRFLEQEYVQNVRDGAIKEELSTDILNTYGPEKISEISYAGHKIPQFYIYYGIDRVLETNWDCYIIWDKSKKTKDCDIWYDALNNVLTAIGFHMTCDRNSLEYDFKLIRLQKPLKLHWTNNRR